MSNNNSNKYNTKQVSSSNKEGRDKNGRFVPGMPPVAGTPFELNNTISCKYKEEYCDSIINYFLERANESNNNNLYKRSYYQNGNIKSEEPIVRPPRYPTFELFAISIGVTPYTLLNWCKQYPRFRESYAQAKSIQLAITKVYAMEKLYDSNFAKFICVNEHDMKDRQEVSAEIKQLTPDEQNLLAKIGARLNG